MLVGMEYTFEDLLAEVGGYGPYQRRLVNIYLVATMLACPLFFMTFFFMMTTPDHWCDVQGGEVFNFTLEEWKNITLPRETGADGLLRLSKCKMYEVTDNLTRHDLLDNNITSNFDIIDCPADTGWAYDWSEQGETLPSYFGWVCDSDEKVPLVFTVISISSVIGLALFTPLADRFGRKLLYYIIILVYTVTGIASTFANDADVFIVLTFLKSLHYPTTYTLPFVHVIEFMSPENRSYVNFMTNILWALGVAVAPLIAWICRQHWKILNLVLCGVAPSLFLYYPFLKDSPRWLIVVGKYEEAENVLEQMAKRNGKPMPSDITVKIKKIAQAEQAAAEAEMSAKEVLRLYKQVMRMLCIGMCWSAAEIMYTGLHLNLNNMAGNTYLNYLAIGAIEIPSYIACWLVVDRIGRRWTTTGSLLLCGLSCLLVVAVPAETEWLVLLLVVIAKFFDSATFMVLYMHAAEMFPTSIRSVGVAVPSCLSMLVIIGVPYLIHEGQEDQTLPYIVMGSLCLVTSILALLLPETTNKSLPQTVEEADKFGNDQKLWSMNLSSGISERKTSYELEKL